MRPLPERRLETLERERVRVRRSSTIRVKHNTYSVPARLIGEEVEVRSGLEEIAVWYAEQQVQRLPRLRGQDKHRIDYRHLIGWLVRKPGAFARYVYREDLYPTLTFRRADDALLIPAAGPRGQGVGAALVPGQPGRRNPGGGGAAQAARPASAAVGTGRAHAAGRSHGTV